jgi:hypothetical protein
VIRILSLIAVVAVAAMLITLDQSPATEHRSRAVAREFQHEHPCPSTGSATGAYSGYVRDHVIPLGCGGPDAVSNMQWRTVEAAKAKDAWELQACSR